MLIPIDFLIVFLETKLPSPPRKKSKKTKKQSTSFVFLTHCNDLWLFCITSQVNDCHSTVVWKQSLRLLVMLIKDQQPGAGSAICWTACVARCSTLISHFGGLLWSSILYVDLSRWIERILNLCLWILWTPMSGSMFQERCAGQWIVPIYWYGSFSTESHRIGRPDWLWHANLGWFPTHIGNRIIQGSGCRLLSIYVSNFPCLPSELQC